MRIAILGAGALGSWFGGNLALNGNSVHLITTNKAHIDAVQCNGLELRSGAGSSLVQLPVTRPDNFATEVDLLIVLTKTFQLNSALGSVVKNLRKDTKVLSLQNGLGNEETIAKHVGLENTWLGVTMLPVARTAPGVVTCKGAGQTFFGEAGAKRPAFAERLESTLQEAGLDARYDIDIKKRVWQKVAFNVGMNALCALTHGTPGLIGKSDAVKSMVRQAALETAEGGKKKGGEIDVNAVFDTIDFACEKHGSHLPSMLQDLLNGKPTEVEALNGAVARYAHLMGVDAPLNVQLAELIRLAEKAHAHKA